jgi:hypothetical protein
VPNSAESNTGDFSCVYASKRGAMSNVVAFIHVASGVPNSGPAASLRASVFLTSTYLEASVETRHPPSGPTRVSIHEASTKPRGKMLR